VKNEFSLQYKATIGADFLSKSIQKNDDTVQLQLWDTAGAEKYHSMGQSFYRNSEICILVFDITDSESFKNIESWRTEFLEQLNPPNPNEFPFVLIGNKCDLQKDMQVDNEAIQNYIKEHNDMPFYMCSAKDNINLEEAFNKIVEMAIENNKKNEDNFVPQVQNLKLGQEPPKKKKCCK
jgi:Ras-related protein Rab-7A